MMVYFNNWTAMSKMLMQLLNGTRNTLTIFCWTLLFSIPLGVLVALGRMSRHGVVWRPLHIYILIMRGTPLILQILFVYFALPLILPGSMRIDRYWAAVIACALNYAAYFAEIFRGGIQSMPVGQYEAAQMLGFTRAQTFFRIILPQVVKRVLLPVSNEVITLVKDTALVSTIGLYDLYSLASKEVNRTASLEPLVVAGVFYLVFTFVITKAFMLCEKKLNYYR
ncbi:MAG: amino acid ABC transporter permease [Candidatus Fimadaptatus sp.]